MELANNQGVLFITAMAVLFLTAHSDADTVGRSAIVTVDTRSLSQMTAAEVEVLDIRSRSTSWSKSEELDTRKIKGTLITLK